MCSHWWGLAEDIDERTVKEVCVHCKKVRYIQPTYLPKRPNKESKP